MHSEMGSFPYMKICLQTNMLHTHTVLMCILSKIPIAILKINILDLFFMRKPFQPPKNALSSHSSSTRHTIKPLASLADDSQIPGKGQRKKNMLKAGHVCTLPK